MLMILDCLCSVTRLAFWLHVLYDFMFSRRLYHSRLWGRWVLWPIAAAWARNFFCDFP